VWDTAKLAITYIFLFAPESRQRLAGGETTGKPVIIAFAPLPGREGLAARTRRFHHRLISMAFSVALSVALSVAKCLKLRSHKNVGNDNLPNCPTTKEMIEAIAFPAS
jgi:hypothetical protein